MESDIEALEQHLLYHKAMAETPEELERVNGYLSTLEGVTNGERLNDPVDEASRRMFELIIENGLDPWDIDIEEFASMYAAKVSTGVFDLVVAGKLMYMAWCVVHGQADRTLAMYDEPVCDDLADDDDTFVESDEDFGMVIPVNDVVFTPAHSRVTTRKVTFMDLMEAFDEAVEEEELRKERIEALEEERKQHPKPAKERFNNRAHEEDDETVVKRCYKTIIQRAEQGPVTMKGLYNGNLKDSVSFFVSVLHLVRYGLLEIEQASLPNGTITIRVVDPTAEVPLATEA